MKRFAIVCCVLLVGCAELDARRTVQKADKLNGDGEYAKAIALYEEALSNADLPTAHHNLAITAFNAFQPGVETDNNQKYAVKASEHFQRYLESNPGDNDIVDLLTTVWIDSNQNDTALAYWKKAQAKAPKSMRVLEKLRMVHLNMGDHQAVIDLDYQRVALSSDVADKVRYLDLIGRLQRSRLRKRALVSEDRIAVADVGIEAMQTALMLDPNSPAVHVLLSTLYQGRSFAHYGEWASYTDIAAQQYHLARYKELNKAKTAAQASAAAAAPKNEEPTAEKGKE